MIIDKKDLKILFMGTPDFAKASLEALVKSGYNVIGVFTNPDKPSGRGMKVTMSPVKQFCIENSIEVFQPQKLRNNPQIIEILDDLKPNLICVTAYGKILPKEVLDYPKYGAINVHGSLLPKYRGAAPIQWSIINGDNITGITTMYMDEGMDTGDMLLKEKVEITSSDNFESLHDKMKIVGAKLLVKTIDKLCKDELQRVKQSSEYTLAPMIDKDLGKLDFNKTSVELYNLIRGLCPTPGTYFFDNVGKRYKVYKINYYENDNNKNVLNGTIINITKDKLSIKCKNGYIDIIIIQPENSKKMDVCEFLKGSKFKIGDILN